MYHCLPGVVKAYHAGAAGRAATVDVQPAVHDVRFDLDTGERVSEPWPVIPNVPVQTVKFGGFTVSGPMKAGDHVVLHAFDLDPSHHRTTGNPEDPVDVRRHGGNYWVAVPGNITDPGALQDGAAAGDGLLIGVDGGQAQIRITEQAIQLGAGGGDAVALASILDSFIKVFLSSWTPVPNDGGAALKTALAAWALGPPVYTTTASQLVKTQ